MHRGGHSLDWVCYMTEVMEITLQTLKRLSCHIVSKPHVKDLRTYRADSDLRPTASKKMGNSWDQQYKDLSSPNNLKCPGRGP